MSERGQRALKDLWLTNHAASAEMADRHDQPTKRSVRQVVFTDRHTQRNLRCDARTEAAIIPGSAMECDFGMARRRPGD
jgi:hypothetical protein